MTRMKLLLQIAAVLFILCLAVGAVSATGNTVKDTWVTSTGTTYAGNNPSISGISVSTNNVYNISNTDDLVYFNVSTIKATLQSSTQDNLTYKFTLPTTGSAGSNVSVKESGIGTEIRAPQFTIDFGDGNSSTPELGTVFSVQNTYTVANHYVPAVTLVSAWNPSTTAWLKSNVSVDPAFIDVNKTTISFENGTGVQFTETFTYQGPVGSVSPSSKTGFTFHGWNLSETMLFNDIGEPQEEAGYITGDSKWVNSTATALTVNANWTRNNYWVNYSMQGHGSQATNVSLPFESTVTAPSPEPSETGYSFNGWYNESACTNVWNFTTDTVPAADTILYANWTANTYNVTFNNNTGSGIMNNQTFTYGVAQILNANEFTKSGYTFAGWNKTSADGTAIDYADGASVKNLIAVDNGVVSLYAVWTANSQPQYYSSSSSHSTGYTQILSEVQAAPTVTPTVAQTQAPATPTVSPVTQPTTESTQKSPAPFVGLIAGLGVAAVLVLRRK